MSGFSSRSTSTYPGGRRKDGGVQMVQSLCDLFAMPGGEEEADGEEVDSSANGGTDGDSNSFDNAMEVQTLDICGTQLQVRQFLWHEANANQVWPGAFTLAEYMTEADSLERYKDGIILELGAATGALAAYLTMPRAEAEAATAVAVAGTTEPREGDQEAEAPAPATRSGSGCGFNVITADIKDDGIVKENVAHNFRLNGLQPRQHVEHTWGTPWPEEQLSAASVKFIVASDILLYVAAYEALVSTLSYFFDAGGVGEFLMCWNRRIHTTPIFFGLMRDAGFVVENLPKCMYRFTRLVPGASDCKVEVAE